jgi:hypothetical protein
MDEHEPLSILENHGHLLGRLKLMTPLSERKMFESVISVFFS